jgi:hypothetical protein
MTTDEIPTPDEFGITAEGCLMRERQWVKLAFKELAMAAISLGAAAFVMLIPPQNTASGLLGAANLVFFMCAMHRSARNRRRALAWRSIGETVARWRNDLGHVEYYKAKLNAHFERLNTLL